MGDEENALDLSLSDQQAVERILVQIGSPATATAWAPVIGNSV